MARLIQIGSTFRPDDLLCGIGFCAGLLRFRFRLTARVLDRRSFFRAHGASRPARFQSEPGAPCVRELMRFGEARAPTRDRVLAARLPVTPRPGCCTRARASPAPAVPVALRTVSYTVPRTTARRRAAGPARSRKARDTDGYTPRTRASRARLRARNIAA